MQRKTDFADVPLLGASFAGNGLVAIRRRDGRLQTNISHYITNHSPDGFNIGYSGSGPADLSLNVLEQFLRYKRYNGDRTEAGEVRGGSCFRLAWWAHQRFKEQFIAKSNREVRVTIREIDTWLRKFMDENPQCYEYGPVWE